MKIDRTRQVSSLPCWSHPDI